MVIDLLVQRGFLASSLSVTVDVLTTASTLARALSLPFDVTWRVLTRDGGPVPSTSGLAVAADGPWEGAGQGLALGFGVGMADEARILEALATEDGRDLTARLGLAHERGATVAASCSSTFFLAEAGLLRDGEATTCWWLAPLFRRRYPDVALRAEQLLTHHGRVVCAGAALAQLELVLDVVGRLGGQELCELTARYLVVERPASGQGPATVPHHLALRDPVVARAERWIRERLHGPVDVDELARAVAVSTRTLGRRFVAATGLSPASYVRRARAEEAARLLLVTDRSVGEIALAVGYAEEGALRRTFVDTFGEAPLAWRRRRTLRAPGTPPRSG